MPETLENFHKKQEQLAEWLDRAANDLLQLGHRIEAYALTEQANLAREFRFSIAVIGEFSSGKSTLLNAFLGKELLPAKMPPCTATPVAISFGESERLWVYRKSQTEPEERPLSDLLTLVVLKADNEEGVSRERAESDLERIEIHVPLEICRHRVLLWDTPGLNEAAARNEITLSLLPKVDAAIVLMTAMHLLSNTEREFLEREVKKDPRSRRWVDNCFVVVTFSDVAQEDSSGLSELRQRLDNFCNGLLQGGGIAPKRRYFIDAKSVVNRRIGKITKTDGLEFEKLQSDISTFIVQERGTAGWRSQLLRAQKVMGDAFQGIESEILSLKRKAEDVQKEAAAAKQALVGEQERLDRMANGMRKLGKRFVRDLANDFLVTSNRWVRANLPEYLASLEYPETIIADVKKPATWFSDRALTRIQDQMQHWANTIPAEKLRELIEEFENTYRDDLAEMKKNLGVIGQRLGLSLDLGETMEQPGMGWLVQSAAGFLAGGPFGALVGSTMGWSGVLTNLGINFGVGLTAALVGLSIPVVGMIVIAAVVGLIQIIVGQRGIQERIRNKVLDALREKIPPKLEEAASEVEASARKQVEQLASLLVESGKSLISRLHEAAVIAEQSAQKDEIQRFNRVNILEDTKTRLNELCANLETA